MKRPEVRLVLVMLLCACLASVGCLRTGARRDTVFYTAEELEASFRERHDEFVAVAEMFLENERIDELMSTATDRVILTGNPKYDDRLDAEWLKDCFSDAERERIKALFEETGLSYFEYNARTKPEHVRFQFGDSSEHTTLYCLSSEDGAEAFFHNIEVDSVAFYQIEEHWYIQKCFKTI